MNANFWRGKRVLVTGHTGFKGAWLTLWLSRLGAEVSGFALPPPTNPSLFALARVKTEMRDSILADLRDKAAIAQAMRHIRPEIVFHLAAQPLVRRSFANPEETYATNIMGLVNLLEAARTSEDLRALVVVTSDKCYENREWFWSYRENEALGGFDPYSSSKACAEIISAAYRRSFFADKGEDKDKGKGSGVALATARAGNVIGGGDWAEERLIPDAIAAFLRNEPLRLRHPEAIRPWQHVLEPLSGYLLLAEKLFTEGSAWAEAWNFGPAEADALPVRLLVARLAKEWGLSGEAWVSDAGEHPHEAGILKLDAAKARSRLNWQPRWGLERALVETARWYSAWRENEDMRSVTERQIADFEQRTLNKEP